MLKELSQCHSISNLKQYLKQKQRDMTPVQPTILLENKSSFYVVLPGDELHEISPGGNDFLFCFDLVRI
jgi:hypothetical protein